MALDFTALRAARDALGVNLNTKLLASVSADVIEPKISESLPAAAPGQIPFIKDDGTNLSSGDYPVVIGAFTNSSSELSTAKTIIVNNETVFNTWHRFSHRPDTEAQPALPAEITTWSYDSTTDALANTTNSSSYIGVISTKKYVDYDLDVRLTSTNSDDDTIGVVIAWYVDPDTGREYTLSVVRSCGGNTPIYALIYNYFRSDAWIINNANTKVKWSNGNFGATAAAAGWDTATAPGWVDFGTVGVKLRVIRKSDVIEVITSQFGSGNTYDNTTKLTLNLTSDPRLMKFRGPRKYGYCAFSQTASKWSVLSFSDNANTIYDLALNQVWKYSAGTATWAIDATASLAKGIGKGRLLHNPNTSKTFYVDDAGVVSQILLGT